MASSPLPETQRTGCLGGVEDTQSCAAGYGPEKVVYLVHGSISERTRGRAYISSLYDMHDANGAITQDPKKENLLALEKLWAGSSVDLKIVDSLPYCKVQKVYRISGNELGGAPEKCESGTLPQAAPGWSSLNAAKHFCYSRCRRFWFCPRPPWSAAPCCTAAHGRTR